MRLVQDHRRVPVSVTTAFARRFPEQLYLFRCEVLPQPPSRVRMPTFVTY